MANKLEKLLKQHDSAQLNNELAETFTPSSEVGDINAIVEGFDVPSLNGQSMMELQDEVSPGYLEACLKMANRAMTGQVNPFKEGDLPHKMALLLAQKMLPTRKIGEKPVKDTPEHTKQVSRALKSLIRSLTIDGEVVIDSGDGSGQADIGKAAAMKEAVEVAAI
jgi:hypothetical protein